MFKSLLDVLVFLAGLAVVCWIGVGYVDSNPLGAAVAAVIGASYLAGAWELFRYRAATASLRQAVADASPETASLGEWLGRLHPGLRQAVRLRIEGERAGLPAPALTSYLVGLLVLLGMLGTLLGMMATLRGTGSALQSATDLQAIRGSLAAPVNGLAFAFGTSIAGVASSAMLGLLSALCRRERSQAVQQLDARIGTTLRIHSKAHQREEAFKLLQRQTELMPALVERLQGMMAAIEQQNAATGERQLASQASFHAVTEATYARLASSVEQSLKDTLAESARAIAEVLQPIVATTMDGIAQETASLHDTVTQAVRQHQESLSASAEATSKAVTDIWNDALAQQRQIHARQADDLRGSLEQFAATFEQRSTDLLDGVSARLDATAGHAAQALHDALSQQQTVNQALADRNQQALTLAAASFEEHATSLVHGVNQSHAELQSTLESQDRQRLSAWSEKLDAIGTALNRQWQQASELASDRQQAICDTLARTANDVSAQAQAHASATIAEISRLVDAASEAPRIAAEVVAELRQKLSDSMVRDTGMLEERSRLLATLETLLDAVNHASTEQRSAIDALVATSADLLDRVGRRFSEQVADETGKLDAVAAQLTGSAVEVASLGEAFGAGVAQFSTSNEALMERLQQIAGALDASLARSDEQLAYYVAQAREVVDLSVLSQKQIIEDMQRLARQQGAAADAPA